MEEIDMTRSINLSSLLVIIGLFEGLFIGIYLLFRESIKHRANRYLGSLVLTIVTVLIPGFLFRIGLLPEFPHVVHIHFITLFLFGPLAYFYVRICTQKGFRLKPKLLLHFVPAIIFLIYHLPFYTQSGAAKVNFFLHYFVTGDVGIPPWVILIRILHPVVYFFICIKLILDYKKHLANSTSVIDFTYHRWLMFFCGILLFPILTAIVMGLTGFRYISVAVALGFLFIFIMMIHLAILIKPSLFNVFPHQMLLPDSTEEKKQKYENSTLQTPKKEQYVDKLVTFVETKKPYLSPDLTLSELSKQVGIPPHYVSQVINEKLNCNFLDFINQYRVKEAQAKLIDPKCNHYTVISIAYDAGFNSKSTFYTAFKKQAMMTPSQYRKQHA